MAMLSFDRARVDSLRLALGASLEELHAIRCSNAAAADVMRTLAGARRTIEDWLPRVHDILYSTAMTSCTRSALGMPDLSQAAKYAVMYHHGREVITDPLAVQGPPAPTHDWSIERVLAAIESGALQPMRAPLDANGRANAPYESLAFAPSVQPVELGRIDLTSDVAKFAAFWSEGLPAGYTREDTLTVFRLEDVRTTKSVHPLTAFDRDGGPETFEDMTSAMTTSGYLVITQVTEEAELTHEISEGGDPTTDFAYAEQVSSAFSGTFYPDAEAVFEPLPTGPRVESPARWTFTTSASPMTDDWGTWRE